MSGRARSSSVRASSISPADTIDRASMRALGVRSHVTLPLTVNGQVVGVVAFGVPPS